MSSLHEANIRIHALSDVQTINIGRGTIIWQFAVVLPGAVIGEHCNINCHTFIENDVRIGNNVTIKSGVYIWDGIYLEDDVFIGPSVVFTNDFRPRSKQRVIHPKTYVQKGASVGANTTILAGVNIGKYAMTGISSVVTHDVPDHALVYGSPAKVYGWVDEKGNGLKQVSADLWQSEEGNFYEKTNSGLLKK